MKYETQTDRGKNADGSMAWHGSHVMLLNIGKRMRRRLYLESAKTPDAVPIRDYALSAFSRTRSIRCKGHL